jgi:hypothetical protein
MAMKATPPKQTLTRMTNAILVMLVERRKEWDCSHNEPAGDFSYEKVYIRGNITPLPSCMSQCWALSLQHVGVFAEKVAGDYTPYAELKSWPPKYRVRQANFLFYMSILLFTLYFGSEKTKLHGLSPRANYTNRATAACRWNDYQLLWIEGPTWSAWPILTAVFSVF